MIQSLVSYENKSTECERNFERPLSGRQLCPPFCWHIHGLSISSLCLFVSSSINRNCLRLNQHVTCSQLEMIVARSQLTETGDLLYFQIEPQTDTDTSLKCAGRHSHSWWISIESMNCWRSHSEIVLMTARRSFTDREPSAEELRSFDMLFSPAKC